MTNNDFNDINKQIKQLNKQNEELLSNIKNNERELKELRNYIFLLRNEIEKVKNKNIFSNIKNSISNHFSSNTKKMMILRLAINILFHPISAYSLIFKIKKCNMHYGDHIADIMYLKEGSLSFKKNDKPKVSIIIPVYNQYKFTYKCLKSILNNVKDVTYEIIIADDVSYDGTKVLSKYVSNINVIRNKQNLGFLKNCNNAAKTAKGEYIIFLNNDTLVTEKWLSSLVELIESDNSIGMVGSKLVYPDGRLQEAGGVIHNDGSACNYGKFDDPNKPEYNYVRDVDYMSGASILISKKLWDEIGGFDETFAPAYCEDSDLAFEVRKRGYRVLYQPKSVVIHFEGVSNGTDTLNTTLLKHYQIENQSKLYSKWKKELENHPSKYMNRDNFKYRDRIKGKKVILVVDHFVPEFDRDAGSRTTFEYLNMFIKQGFIVKFLGDNFNNKEPYTSILEQKGIEVLYGKKYHDEIFDWIDLNKDNIDFIYLNRPHIALNYIKYFKNNTNAKIIYYGHDLHFLREQREYELNHDETHKFESEKWKNIELDIMRNSDIAYYPSYIEKNVINEIDPKIKVKAINAYICDKIDENYKLKFKKRKGLIFVGGFRHRPNVDGITWFVENIYPIVKSKLNIPLYIVGSEPPREIMKLEGNGITILANVSDEKLKELYDTVKIVIVPLRFGAGIKGKVIEAMSRGLPIVTTSVGAEGIKNSEKILNITDDVNDFANKIIELYDNNDKLEELSNAEIKYINDNFTIESAWNIIKDDFK